MNAQFLPAAETEYLEQLAYYESKQAGLGTRYLAEIKAALEYICEAPHRFRIVRPPAVRRLNLKLFPFAILFRETDSIVLVIAVAPHRRRPDYWRER